MLVCYCRSICTVAHGIFVWFFGRYYYLYQAGKTQISSKKYRVLEKCRHKWTRWTACFNSPNSKLARFAYARCECIRKTFENEKNTRWRMARAWRTECSIRQFKCSVSYSTSWLHSHYRREITAIWALRKCPRLWGGASRTCCHNVR